jgi:hypothetical protein
MIAARLRRPFHDSPATEGVACGRQTDGVGGSKRTPCEREGRSGTSRLAMVLTSSSIHRLLGRDRDRAAVRGLQAAGGHTCSRRSGSGVVGETARSLSFKGSERSRTTRTTVRLTLPFTSECNAGRFDRVVRVPGGRVGQLDRPAIQCGHGGHDVRVVPGSRRRWHGRIPSGHSGVGLPTFGRPAARPASRRSAAIQHEPA